MTPSALTSPIYAVWRSLARADPQPDDDADAPADDFQQDEDPEFECVVVAPQRPPSLLRAEAALRARYPNDVFRAVWREGRIRPGGRIFGWRVVCDDCPGKVCVCARVQRPSWALLGHQVC
jgi:hypothetical protein